MRVVITLTPYGAKGSDRTVNESHFPLYFRDPNICIKKVNKKDERESILSQIDRYLGAVTGGGDVRITTGDEDVLVTGEVTEEYFRNRFYDIRDSLKDEFRLDLFAADSWHMYLSDLKEIAENPSKIYLFLLLKNGSKLISLDDFMRFFTGGNAAGTEFSDQKWLITDVFRYNDTPFMESKIYAADYDGQTAPAIMLLRSDHKPTKEELNILFFDDIQKNSLEFYDVYPVEEEDMAYYEITEDTVLPELQ